MSQTFTAITSATTMGNFPGLYNDSIDAIRSQWSGASAPGSPVIGQPFYNTTNGSITVWNGTAWKDIAATSPSLLALTAEIVAARGSAATLDARLSVALNPDGTLKGDAPVSDWWMTEADAVAFVDATSFTVAGDKTAIYLADRAVWLDQTTNAYGYVVSSSYNAVTTLTTVVVSDVTVDSGLTAVEYGQPVNNAPNRLKESDVSESVVGSSIVRRSSLGDILCRLVSLNFATETRNSDTIFYSSTNNYMRKNTKAGFLTSLGLNYATQAEAEAGTAEDVVMSPLRTFQAIDEKLAAVDGGTKIAIITATRDLSAASGTVDYTGAGFDPTHALVWYALLGGAPTALHGSGSFDGTTNELFTTFSGAIAQRDRSTFVLAQTQSSLGQDQEGVCSFISDGIRISWTKTGTPTGTLKMRFVLFG